MTSKQSVVKDVFEFPERHGSSTEQTVKAKCKICGSLISGSKKVTSNFLTHVQRRHPTLLAELKEKGKMNDQPSLDHFVQMEQKTFSSSDSRQLKITNSLTMFIAGSLMPLSLVENSYFRDLLHSMEPRFNIPSRKHLTLNLIRRKCEAITWTMKQEFEKIQSMCLTIDLWSSRQMKGFIGFTGHYIMNWNLESVTLGSKRFKGRHAAENILQQYEETIAAFNLCNTVSHIVTDNAGNITKAFTFSSPGFVNDSSCGDSDDIESDCDDEYISSDEIDVDDNDTVCDYLPEHQGCFAHTLQLTVNDGLKESGQIGKVIAKASNIVSHVRRSTHATDILVDEKRLQSATQTRWNSQLKMMRSILDIPEEELEKISASTLSKYERNILSDVVEILAPFEEATDLVQGQNIVTSSLVVPCVKGLKAQTESTTSNYNCKLVSTIKTSVNKRLSPYESKDEFTMASTLDPRLKLNWYDNQQKQKR